LHFGQLILALLGSRNNPSHLTNYHSPAMLKRKRSDSVSEAAQALASELAETAAAASTTKPPQSKLVEFQNDGEVTIFINVTDVDSPSSSSSLSPKQNAQLTTSFSTKHIASLMAVSIQQHVHDTRKKTLAISELSQTPHSIAPPNPVPPNPRKECLFCKCTPRCTAMDGGVLPKNGISVNLDDFVQINETDGEDGENRQHVPPTVSDHGSDCVVVVNTLTKQYCGSLVAIARTVVRERGGEEGRILEGDLREAKRRLER